LIQPVCEEDWGSALELVTGSDFAS